MPFNLIEHAKRLAEQRARAEKDEQKKRNATSRKIGDLNDAVTTYAQEQGITVTTEQSGVDISIKKLDTSEMVVVVADHNMYRVKASRGSSTTLAETELDSDGMMTALVDFMGKKA